MKKSNMCTITGSSGRDCVLFILFHLYSSKAGFFEGNLFWVGQYDPPNFVLEEELIQCYNLIQFLSNLSKIVPSQKTADIILQMLTSLAFVASQGKKIQKIDENS